MPAVTDWRMSHHEDFLQQGQITPGDVVGAYGFNTLAACPSLGGQYFPLNMAPCLALSSSCQTWGTDAAPLFGTTPALASAALWLVPVAAVKALR